jgi:hypothetical protein
MREESRKTPRKTDLVDCVATHHGIDTLRDPSPALLPKLLSVAEL